MTKKITPKLGILETIEQRIGEVENTTNDSLQDILQRLQVLESYAESKDAVIKLMELRMQNRDKIIEMLRDHTLRLVKEKEQLLLNLGLKRMNELKDGDKDKDIIT